MSGCIYRDSRGVACSAPIGDRQSQMCARHAAQSRGFGQRAQANHSFASRLERWPNPPKTWRTIMCNAALHGRPCRMGHTCSYAHTKEQLRYLDDPLPNIIYRPCVGAGEEPPPPPRTTAASAASSTTPAAPRTIQTQLNLTDPSAKHPLWNVAAAEIEPEQCSICYDDDKFADRRWVPCGHMVCSECMTNWRTESISKRVNGTPCHLCRAVVTGNEVLPKAEQKNAIGKQSTNTRVWADPEARAALAQGVVGSTLTLEEERIMEANMRQKHKEEQERLHKLEDVAAEARLMQEHEDEIQKLLSHGGKSPQAPPQLQQQQYVPPPSSAAASLLPPLSQPLLQPASGSLLAPPVSTSTAFPPYGVFSSSSSPPPLSFSPSLATTATTTTIGNPSPFAPPGMMGGFGFAREVPRNATISPPPTGSGGAEMTMLKKAPPPGFGPSILLSPSPPPPTLAMPAPPPLPRSFAPPPLLPSTTTTVAANEGFAMFQGNGANFAGKDLAGLSSWELEKAALAAKRLEQEAQDYALAKRLAEELNQPSAAPPPAVAARQRKPAIVTMNDNWNCSYCTFENEALHPQCAMCEEPRGNRQ